MFQKVKLFIFENNFYAKVIVKKVYYFFVPKHLIHCNRFVQRENYQLRNYEIVNYEMTQGFEVSLIRN